MSEIAEQKGLKDYYRRPDIASAYLQRRFAGSVGEAIDAREKAIYEALFLDADNAVLDCACGTGRLTTVLRDSGANVIGIDASPSMLAEARRLTNLRLICGDVGRLPFEDKSFDAVTFGRFFQHIRNIEDSLQEPRRILRPGGRLYFDTYLWSPRVLFIPFRRRWKEVYGHLPGGVAKALDRAGFELEELQSAFVLPPGMMKMLPPALFRTVAKLERCCPGKLLCRHFWRARKRDS